MQIIRDGHSQTKSEDIVVFTNDLPWLDRDERGEKDLFDTSLGLGVERTKEIRLTLFRKRLSTDGMFGIVMVDTTRRKVGHMNTLQETAISQIKRSNDIRTDLSK